MKKACFKCEKELPLEDFYKHSKMADGHLNKCKACTKNDVFKHRRNPESRERVLAYDRARGNRQGPEYRQAHREANPLAVKARYMVNNAVRDGKLEKPDRCSHCNETKRLVGHHEDYTRPLEVVWLCDACHRQLHAFYETIGREIPGKGQAA